MSKKRPTVTSGRGEELLGEWDVASDPTSLRAAWGRDPEADLAIVARLAGQVNPEAAAILVDFESNAASKALRKEIRRVLFRFEQRGIAVPRHAPEPAAPLLGAPATEGYLSHSDGGGDQLLWLVRPRPDGLAHLVVVANDPDGMRDAELHLVTRKSFRAAREELAQKHLIEMVEADWHYVDHRMWQSWQWARARQASVEGDYLGLRAQLVRDPASEAPHPIWTVLGREALQANASLLAESAEALQEREFMTWFIGEPVLRPYLDELDQAMHSKLVLNPYQREERMNQVVERAVEAHFGGALQASYVRRLLDIAWVQHATRRPLPAQRVAAAALGLEASRLGGRGVPLCETLVRASIGALLKATQEREKEEARGALIVRP